MNMFSFSSSTSYVIRVLCLKRLLLNSRFLKCDCLNKKCISYHLCSLQISHLYITTNFVQNLHTIKGWKTVARDGHKEHNAKKEFLSCEEGKDAVPHHVLMNHLQNCNTVSDQIKTFCSTISIPPEEVENRKDFCRYLTNAFKPYLPQLKVNLFGSSVNGLGFKGSDVDVSIQTPFSDEECVKDIKRVPTLESVLNGEVSADEVAHLPPKLLLRFIRRILRKDCTDINERIFLIKARCPLLRFYNSKYDVFCDFSCESHASLRNTKLVRLLCQLDERFPILTKVIRYWGKYGGFVGDIDLFNSYSFSLLTVHFLQLRNPPVLPPLKDVVENSEYVMNGQLDDDELFYRDLKKFKPSQNSQTVEELLKEYFFHYLTFDFSQMLLPVSSSVMPKMDFIPEITQGSEIFEFSTITLQDPFRKNFNTTAGAQYRACKRFLNNLVDACTTYQNENMWHPNVDNWGICSLFQRLSEQDFNKKYESNIYTIKFPLKTDISLVIKILQECLLFDCSALGIEGSGQMIQPSSRLNFRVYSSTWIGREWIFKTCPSSLVDQFEIEKWISNQIRKNKVEPQSQLLFTFVCEFFENTCDNELDVVLTFNKSKFPLVLAIFLKEYVPSMCKKFAL